MPTKTRKKSRPPKEFIDGDDFSASRKSWNPAPERMERELGRINRRLAGKHNRRKAG